MADLSALRIRPMVPADLEPAIAAVRDGGWGDRRPALTFYLAHPASHPLVAESDGAIVGTAIATCSAAVGWLGLVFVAPALRGQGLGAALTRASLDLLTSLGCRSVLLAASTLGQPIYDRLGFVVDGGYAVWTGPPGTTPNPPLGTHSPTDPRLRRLTPDDLTATAELDARITAEDRTHALRALSDGWVITEDHRVCGYALRTPWGLGPAIAENRADGLLLLDVLLGQARSAPATLIVPTANLAAQEHLAARGLRIQNELPRMRLGEPVPWQPQRIWAIFNFALG